MTKQILLFFAIFGIYLNFYGQNDIKHWEDGKLSWYDFQGTPEQGGMFYLKNYFGFSTNVEKSNDTIVRRIKAYTYILKKGSWVNSAYMTEQYLKYNQVIFNIMELQKRKFQYDLDRVKSPEEVNELFNLYSTALENEINKFKNVSNSGHNTEIINDWEQKTLKEINSYGNKKIPNFRKSNLGLGIYAGVGANIALNNNYLSGGVILRYGLNAIYKKVYTALGVSLAGGTLKNDMLPFAKGDKYSIGRINIYGGYTIKDDAKIQVIPYLSFKSGTIDFNVKEQTNPSGQEFGIGIKSGYKIKKVLSLVPSEYFSKKTYTELLLYCKIEVSRFQYGSDNQCYFLSLTLGVNNLINYAKVID